MEEALTDRLLATSGLTALVSTRIRWNVRAQNDNPPCVVLHKLSTIPAYYTGGRSDLASSRVQIDCWGATAISALNVARQVKAAMPTAPTTISGVDFQFVGQVGERSDYFGDTPASRLHRVSLDFQVWHTSP